MNKRFRMRLVVKRVQYLSNRRASEAATGSPLKLGNSFLLGGTDGTPERGHVLAAATGIGLHGAQQQR